MESLTTWQKLFILQQHIFAKVFQVLEISEDRKEELKLAKYSETMVNVIEDFEHGKHGFYNYGKFKSHVLNSLRLLEICVQENTRL